MFGSVVALCGWLLLVPNNPRQHSLPTETIDADSTVAPKRSYEFHVAPMQGYTSAPLRHLFHLLSPDSILWTEMEKVRDLHGVDPEALGKRFGDPQQQHANKQRLTLQLGGNNVESMEKCVRELLSSGYQFREINLNCGCPSIEAGGADFGASLMKQPVLTRQLIAAIHNACQEFQDDSSTCTTVSLKCRTAVFDTVEDMEATLPGAGSQQSCNNNVQLMEEHYQSLCEYITQAQLGGISHLVLHARPAVLAGFSPKKNRMIPPLNYAFVEKIAAEFPGLRVTLNGGVRTLNELEALVGINDKLHGSEIHSSNHHDGISHGMISSHMAGRWMLRRPLSLAAVQDQVLDHKDGSSKLAADFLAAAMDKYAYFVEHSLSGNLHSLSELCLPLYLVIEELRMEFDGDSDDDDEPERALLSSESEDLLYQTLKDALERMIASIPGSKAGKIKALPSQVHWKRLSSALKTLVGTKVYNKWKRNRNELAP